MNATTCMAAARDTSQTDVSPPDDHETSSPNSTHATPWLTPSTSQRGRQTTRYPDSLGRVPLHRRGTSKTYERLEDLLREAGYKETRVFTPETDHIAPSSATDKDGATNAMRGSVGAVVDFIAGLVSRGSSMSHEAPPPEDSAHVWSQPPSPLAHALHIKNHRAKRAPSKTSLSHTGSSESVRRRIHVDLAADASEHAHAHQIHHPSSQGLPHSPRSYLKAHLHHRDPFSSRHHHRLHDYSSKSTAAKPNSPPNARAYLRHMASAPNIQPLPERPPLSEASLRSHALGRARRQGARPTFILNDQAESDCEPHSRDRGQVHPPLPRNWIESVAKALLTGAGVAAPAVVSDAASTKTARTGSTHKSSALSDKSNRGERGRTTTKPPLLCMQVQEVKARTTEGQVVRTRVMCRSTPTSRASSRVRNSHEDRASVRYGGKKKDVDASKHGKRGKDRDADVVPSLARTRAENDAWMAPRKRYASGWGMGGSVQPDETWSDESDHDDHDEEDEDDEEGELGLDRLLVPARRQHSIQSLRKHLQRPNSHAFGGRGAPGTRPPRSSKANPFGGATPEGVEWGTASWSTSRSREWLEEDEDGYDHVSSGAKWRRGLGQWTTPQGS